LRLIVSIQHPLYQLAEAIDWAKFESEFGTLSVGRAEEIYNGPGYGTLGSVWEYGKEWSKNYIAFQTPQLGTGSPV
jgi:hypothetical protein